MKNLEAYLAALVAAVVVLAVGGYFFCLAVGNEYAVLQVLVAIVTIVASAYAARTVARWLLPKEPPWP